MTVPLPAPERVQEERVPSARTARRRRAWNWALRVLLYVATFAPLLALQSRPSEIPLDVRGAAGLLWVLCLLPSWLYLSQPASRRAPIPFLPLIGVFFGLYFPMSIVMGLSNVYNIFDPSAQFTPLSPDVDYERPVQLALAGWIAALAGYAALGMVLPRPRRVRPTPTRWNVRMLRRVAFAMLLGGLSLDLVQQVIPVPVIIRGMLAFAVMLSRFGMALLVVLAVRGKLSGAQRLALLLALLALSYVQIGHGSVAQFALVILVVFLAVWIAGGRLGLRWLIVGAATVTLFVAMRGVAIEFRRSAWFGEEAMPAAARGQLMLTLVADRARTEGAGVLTHGWDVVLSRSADMDLFADVVRRTPSEVPYWGGRTYLSLVGIAVPRVLWPDKPTKRLGQEFGHRYSYLYPTDYSTSVNLPFLIEFYANFGPTGIILGMLLVGIIYRALSHLLNRPGEETVRTLVGLSLLLPVISIESDFSLVFGGLLLNATAMLIVFRFLQRTAAEDAAATGPRPAHPLSAGRVPALRRA